MSFYILESAYHQLLVQYHSLCYRNFGYASGNLIWNKFYPFPIIFIDHIVFNIGRHKVNLGPLKITRNTHTLRSFSFPQVRNAFIDILAELKLI
jgi:hypothetical protein